MLRGQRIKPGAILECFEPEGVTTLHSSTCSHCQRGTEFPSMRVMHKYVDVCRSCMKLICLGCVGKPCVTWLKQCDIEEALERRRRWA